MAQRNLDSAQRSSAELLPTPDPTPLPSLGRADVQQSGSLSLASSAALRCRLCSPQQRKRRGRLWCGAVGPSPRPASGYKKKKEFWTSEKTKARRPPASCPTRCTARRPTRCKARRAASSLHNSLRRASKTPAGTAFAARRLEKNRQIQGGRRVLAAQAGIEASGCRTLARLHDNP